MKAAVFDTYVPKKEGGLMHFDIIVPESTPVALVHSFGKAYLNEKEQASQPLTTQECWFCHIEQATDEMLAAFAQKGYYILEMQGCN
jgi:hypothetical protein